MDCHDVRTHLVDLHRRRLPAPLRAEVEAHLAGCPACRASLDADEALEGLLRGALPRPAAPASLVAALEAQGAPRAAPPRRPARALAGLALAAAVLLALSAVVVGRRDETGGAEVRLTEELVNDHLRVLASLRPAEVEGGGPHQVKPWFEGRLEFAPVVPEPAGDLVLRGGAVGYVFDRRAAVLQYTLRLHRLTLLVVRAEGLPWPEGASARSGVRGFTVVRWRAGELGYALVSDVAAPELDRVAAGLRAATGP